MKTETMVRQPRQDDRYQVSQALQDLAPLSFSILTARGTAVPLSSAGFVLRSGQSYRVRFVSPLKEDEVQDVRLLEPMEYITVESTLRELDEDGNVVYLIPFRVMSWFTHLQGVLVRLGDLQIVQLPKSPSPRILPLSVCPVVIRPGKYLIISYLSLAIFVPWLLNRIFMAPFHKEQNFEGAVGEALDSLNVGWNAWIWWAACLVGVYFVCAAWNFMRLYRQSRALRGSFRATYPSWKMAPESADVNEPSR